jgi:GT2 family glycosyltransferase
MSNIINTFVFPIVRQDFILPALESLRAHTPHSYRVIVVNQTQPNRDFEDALYLLSDIVIHPHTNYGFAQAANIGARIAPTQYVTIANDDVVFLPNWWEGIVYEFNRIKNVLVVAPSSPKEPGWGYGKPGYIENLTFDEAQDPANIRALTASKNGAVIDGIAMWLVVFKRAEWAELGMFDERFFPGGGEDYDGSSRIYQAGYRAIATSRSWVWHHWGQSKDAPTGFNVALPNARPQWNKLSTKGFGDEGLWHPDCDVWGHSGERTDPTIYQADL